MNYLFIKNIFDRVFALLALFLLSPILIILIFLVKKSFGGDVFFKKTRPGYKSKLFTLIKFRTMNNNLDQFGNLLPEDKRLNSFSRWMRKTSLDELPELINIIRGEMSFVGPRPLLKEYLPLYTSEELKRHNVKPGLSGWAQINGRNNLSWQEKFSLDIWYVKNLNFFLDLYIFLKTFVKVFTGDSVNSSKLVSMEPFRGSKE